MNKSEIINQASKNGKKAAEYDFNHDYMTAKSYSEHTKKLMRHYSQFSKDIWDAHQTAYIEFRTTHRH